MNCWHCDNELIWGGDHDIKCHSVVDVYHPSKKLLKEYEESDKDEKRIKKISKDYIKERDAKKK